MRKFRRLIVVEGALIEVSRNKGGAFSYVCLAMVSSIHTMIATMKIGDKSPNRGILALAIVTACGTSTYVLIPIGTITTLLADIIAFNAAVGPVQRKAKWDIIKIGLKGMMMTFQRAMDLNPVDAALICASGGFTPKAAGGKDKNVFSVTQGATSGTVNAIGNASRKRSCHHWEVSVDGINFITVIPTCDAANKFIGLTPGKRYWFRHTLIMAVGPNGPIQTLFVDVI